jgi:hypothetical protein
MVIQSCSFMILNNSGDTTQTTNANKRTMSRSEFVKERPIQTKALK